jgi:hypothetical protein
VYFLQIIGRGLGYSADVHGGTAATATILTSQTNAAGFATAQVAGTIRRVRLYESKEHELKQLVLSHASMSQEWGSNSIRVYMLSCTCLLLAEESSSCGKLSGQPGLQHKTES